MKKEKENVINDSLNNKEKQEEIQKTKEEKNIGSMKNRVGKGGYIRHSVTPDGDCWYTAFGITRQEAYNLIVKNINSDDLVKLLQPAVHEQLLMDSFFQYLKQKKVLNEQKTHKEIVENICKWEKDLSIISAYLEYDILNKRINAGWVHPGILQALAHLQKITLYIWQFDKDLKLVPHMQAEYAQYKTKDSKEVKNLLFVNGNHFDRLDLIDIDPNANLDPIYPLDSSWNQNIISESPKNENLLKNEKIEVEAVKKKEDISICNNNQNFFSSNNDIQKFINNKVIIRVWQPTINGKNSTAISVIKKIVEDSSNSAVQSNCSVGHVSMELPSGTYISLWPAPGETLSTANKVVDRYDCSYIQDIKNEGRTPDCVVCLYTLNAKNIEKVYKNKKKNKKFGYVLKGNKKTTRLSNTREGNSCCGIVYELLQKGGADNLTYFYQDLMLKCIIVTPDNFVSYIKNLKNEEVQQNPKTGKLKLLQNEYIPPSKIENGGCLVM